MMMVEVSGVGPPVGGVITVVFVSAALVVAVPGAVAVAVVSALGGGFVVAVVVGAVVDATSNSSVKSSLSPSYHCTRHIPSFVVAVMLRAI